LRLRLRFDPQAPILLGTGRDLQQVRESLEVIPGSAVLGALARPLLASAGIYRTHPMVPSQPVPPELQRLLSELQISPLYPVPVEALMGDATTDWQSVEVLPAPCTARTCKRHPGFADPAPGTEQGGDGVVDLWLDRTIHGTSRAHCPRDKGHRLERFRASLYRVGHKPRRYGQASLPTRSQTRVGISRPTETAAEGILFQVEPVEPRRLRQPLSNGDTPSQENSLETGFVFIGEAWLPDDLWQLLAESFGSLDSSSITAPVAIGGLLARGFGQGHLTISVTDESRASLVERLQLFGAAQEKGLPDLLLPGLLRSPWPLEEPGLSPLEEVLSSLAPPPRLRERLEPAPAASALETHPWGGWSMAWGLPKPRRQALAAGSVVTFRLKNYNPDQDHEPLIAWLAQCEERPSSLECGAGWITWFDPFHFDLGATKEGSR